jgi:hypothetical protein
LTESYLCHAGSCQEILRTETAGQEQTMDRHGRRASDMWSFTDFVHLMSLVLPGRRTRKALDDLFDVFDADLSGTLSLAELVQEMGKLHPLRECAPRPPSAALLPSQRPAEKGGGLSCRGGRCVAGVGELARGEHLLKIKGQPLTLRADGSPDFCEPAVSILEQVPH